MSRQLGQVGQDGLVPDKFDITPGEIHNNWMPFLLPTQQYQSTENKKPQLSLRNPCDVMLLEKGTLKGGHSRSLKVAPFGSLGITSHFSSIATTAVACTVCKIFTFEL